MSYTCELFINSGYNTLNQPDSEARLRADSQSVITVKPLQIVQNRIVTSVTVDATDFDTVKNTDHIKIGDMIYYTPNGPYMENTDTCTFVDLVPLFFLSAGGVNALAGQNPSLKIVDGVTERVHVISDEYGEYTLEDPLLIPEEPMKIRIEWFSEKNNVDTKYNTYLESTVDLVRTAASGDATTYTSTTGDVSVPNMIAMNEVAPTPACKYNLDIFGIGSNYAESPSPKTILYNLDDTTDEVTPGISNTKNAGDSALIGIARVRDLGVESCIINQVQIPDFYVEVDDVLYETIIKSSSPTSPVTYTNGIIKELTGKRNDYSTTIPYIMDANVKNNRINYGSIPKFGLISSSGESAEFTGEDIMESSTVQSTDTPTLTYLGDPRLDGKPYFRFKYVNGDNDPYAFFRNAISGLQWKNVPLIYTAASGNALNTLKYENDRKITAYAHEGTLFGAVSTAAVGDNLGALSKNGPTEYAMQKDDGLLVGSKLVDAVSNSDGLLSKVVGFAATAANAVVGAGATFAGAKGALYSAERAKALADLNIQNQIVVPSVNFAFNADIIRDFLGNGVLIYRYVYSNKDIARMDKLLTMYGYRHSKAIEYNDFVNRTKFNYILCNNISLTGNYPRWYLDGIADELKSGVRLWHTKIDPSAYDNNPINV